MLFEEFYAHKIRAGSAENKNTGFHTQNINAAKKREKSLKGRLPEDIFI